MKRLMKSSWFLILVQAIGGFLTYYTLKMYALSVVGGDAGKAGMFKLLALVLGVFTGVVVLYALILALREMRKTKQVTIARGLLFVFSVCMVIFPIYKYYLAYR